MRFPNIIYSFEVNCDVLQGKVDISQGKKLPRTYNIILMILGHAEIMQIYTLFNFKFKKCYCQLWGPRQHSD